VQRVRNPALDADTDPFGFAVVASHAAAFSTMSKGEVSTGWKVPEERLTNDSVAELIRAMRAADDQVCLANQQVIHEAWHMVYGPGGVEDEERRASVVPQSVVSDPDEDMDGSGRGSEASG